MAVHNSKPAPIPRGLKIHPSNENYIYFDVAKEAQRIYYQHQDLDLPEDIKEFIGYLAGKHWV